jgi:hypothetical protein
MPDGVTTTASEAAEQEALSRMRRLALDRIQQLQDENFLDGSTLTDAVAEPGLKREIADSTDWWREQLRRQGYAPDIVERLVAAYVDAFLTGLRDRAGKG